MDVEDDIVLELEDKDREIQKHRDRAEQEKARADEIEQRLADALKRLQEFEKISSEKS
jgi:hypothetical protein